MIAGMLCLGAAASAQSVGYTNFIRQTQFPGKVTYQGPNIPSAGVEPSFLAIEEGGARFDLYTVNSQTLEERLLDTTFVGTVPSAVVLIESLDTTSAIPRTRADQPFKVKLTISGLLPDQPAAPAVSKSVTLSQYAQDYGVGGDGVGIDPSTEILLTQPVSIKINTVEPLTLECPILVPGANRAKLRGQQRFEVRTVDDTLGATGAPSQQLSSEYIQVWPVADGTITGIANGQKLRFHFPQVTLTLNDLYPKSTTYAQVYKGMPTSGKTGFQVTGSQLIVNEPAPVNGTLVISPADLETVIDSNGIWTIELVTFTPFGVERMRDPAENISAVWFEVDRTINVNGSVTTIE